MAKKPALTKYQAFSTQRVQRSQLAFMPGNPQDMDEGQTAALLSALDVNSGGVGLLQTIVVNKSTMHIVGGNHRVREIDGLEQYDESTKANDYSLDVAMIDVTEDRERAIVLALNNPRLQGQPRIDALRTFLEAVPEAERTATGFTSEDCSFLLGESKMGVKDKDVSIGQLLWGPHFTAQEPVSEILEDEPPEPVADPVVKAGELWTLGEHRLLCGDSTKAEDVERLMDGARADLCFTSPPYNAGRTPTEDKMHKDSKYGGRTDSLPQLKYEALLALFTKLALSVCDSVAVNIQLLAGNKPALISYLNKFSSNVADVMIWDKQSAQPAMARKVMNSQFEFVLFLEAAPATRSIGSNDFRGTLSNVYSAPKQTANETSAVHNATFPVHLPAHIIANVSKGSIYEPFSGSGTTIIAGEQLGRRVFAMEIDPAYVQVSLERWAKLTGGDPVREDGVKFSELLPRVGTEEAEFDEDAETVEAALVVEADS